MDKIKSSPRITQPTYDHTSLAPAYAWIGPHAALVAQTHTFLQSILCPHNGCGTCITCTQITTHQHHAITWLYPEKKYTLEQLDIIFSTIAFALDDDSHHFFIIQKADALTPTCANRLLKPIEEPPTGYHFILLAESKNALLPTIRSRCIIRTTQASYEASPFTELYDCFIAKKFISPAGFDQLLRNMPGEWESAALVESLLQYWLLQYKKALTKENAELEDQAETMIGHLKQAMQQLPMPGSGKLFWRNLFLQIYG